MFLWLLLNILYFFIYFGFSVLGCDVGYGEYKNALTGECHPCHKSCKQCTGPLPSNCFKCYGTNVKCHTENGIYCRSSNEECSSIIATTVPSIITNSMKSNRELPQQISSFTYLNVILSIFVLFCIFIGAIYSIKALKKYKCVKETDAEKQPSRYNEEIINEKKELISDEEKPEKPPKSSSLSIKPEKSESSSYKTKSSRNNTQRENDNQTIADFSVQTFILENLDWEKRIRISAGAYGEVFKCRYTDKDGRYFVAVKKPIKPSLEAFEEGAIMRRLSDHPHICPLITTRIDNNMLLVMPLRKDNLSHFLETFPNTPITNKIRYCQQIASGMSYLICKRIIHCDLKASNILVVKENWVEIGDFGLAQNMDQNKKTIGTITHTAKELLDYNRISNSEATDIWSFGVTIWEIFNKTKKIPYQDVMNPVTEIKLLDHFTKNNHLQINHWPSTDDSPALGTIATNMFKCWLHDSKKRPKFPQLLGMFSTLLPESPSAATGHTNSSIFFDNSRPH